MIVSINQPAYLAWMGHYARVAAADLHVVLDDAQYEKNGVQNRNRVRTATGWAWLTVPLLRATFRPLNEVEILDGPWNRKHWRTLESAYGREPGFNQHRDYWREVYGRNWRLLGDLVAETDAWTRAALGITTPQVLSSTLAAGGRKSEWVLAICEEVGATRYLSGPFGRDYLDLRSFERAGVEVEFVDYEPADDEQIDGWGLPALDAIFRGAA